MNFSQIDPQLFKLPAAAITNEVNELLADGTTLIVQAPPGAGKSTLLPLTFLGKPWLNGKKIIMLEPRRLAAKSIAMRMADMINEPVGKTIGYRIRFETKVSKDTRLEVVTEGILTRMLHEDNALENAGLVIFDEFHERSLHADLALALCRESQQILRPDLRILIMSATLDMPRLSAMLNAPVIRSEGRQYPVEIKYTGTQDLMMLPETMARLIAKALRENEGDLLAFLPGEGEIRKCEALLRNELQGIAIHPLYGMLSHKEQFAAIMPSSTGKRKIVLATSIAETSLTIEGIKIVVDSGFSRISRFDPKSGLSRLDTVQVSKDSADQRAGRAGRLAPGVCYRMWTSATHERLLPHRIPEIMEADLASMALDLVKWGIRDIKQMAWLTHPPAASIAHAYNTLEQLNAIENGAITEHGKKIHNLPCHPRIAHMLLFAKDQSSKQLATDIAGVLEERDPLPKEAGIDINLRIEALRRYREHGGQGGKFARIEKVAESYRNLLNIQVNNGPVDPHETGLLLAFAYPERIACSRPGNNAQFQLSNGKYAMAGHQDNLADESWLAVASMDMRDGLGRIFMAAPLNPKDLLPLVKEREVITWDSRKGGLIASRDLRIGSIVLKSTPIQTPDKSHLRKAVSDAIRKEGVSLLNIDESFIRLQNRILSLKSWNTDEDWPDVTTETLMLTNEDWLGVWLDQVKKPDDLKKINLTLALLASLPWEQQEELNALAPEKLVVPSGSKIPIDYSANGDVPAMAVRLQEVFGLADTPIINKGKTPIVMHLLSPGFKSVQVTSDLRSFWNNAYHEVKKELKRRYPKHAWPDDPWTAQAVSKGGIRN